MPSSIPGNHASSTAGIEKDNTYTNDINNSVIANDSDIKGLKEMVHNQTELIYKQNDAIKELTNRRDQIH